MRRTLKEDGKDVAKEPPIHVKYRPRKLSEVLGQKPVTKSLAAALTSKSVPHCFLFTGPAGTGKTTLARIVTDSLDISSENIIELDAAKVTGVDDMRGVTDGLRYNGFGDTPNKAIILNECHRLSAQAWDSLLMSTEEPPSHVFFFFTTTNPDKIPKAMLTRCSAYDLKLVKFDELMDLLEYVAAEEGYEVPQRVMTLIAQSAEGSPRAALTKLAVAHACEDEDEAASLLSAAIENAEVIDLCRMMVRGDLAWPKVVSTLKSLADTPAETIRIMIVNYLNACVIGSRSDKETMRLLDMLECFLKPCNPSDKLGPLLVAFGRYVYP